MNSNRPLNKTAKSVSYLASELKSEKFDVNIPSIIMRDDKPELNEKSNKVKHHLKEMCNRKNFFSLIRAKTLKEVI